MLRNSCRLEGRLAGSLGIVGWLLSGGLLVLTVLAHCLLVFCLGSFALVVIGSHRSCLLLLELLGWSGGLLWLLILLLVLLSVGRASRTFTGAAGQEMLGVELILDLADAGHDLLEQLQGLRLELTRAWMHRGRLKWPQEYSGRQQWCSRLILLRLLCFCKQLLLDFNSILPQDFLELLSLLLSCFHCFLLLNLLSGGDRRRILWHCRFCILSQLWLRLRLWLLLSYFFSTLDSTIH